MFQKNGTFVREMVVAKDTRAEGSVWDVAFSNDAPERFLYVADGLNKTIWILQRDTLAPVSRFGSGGRYPGLFYAVGNVAVDSRAMCTPAKVAKVNAFRSGSTGVWQRPGR